MEDKTISSTHCHHHSHGHHHGHAHGANAPHKVLITAIIIIFGFAVVELLTGWWANSLALMGDAGHMASDALSLVIAAFAAWMSTKPPSKRYSYGFGRAEIIAAWISSLSMLIISISIIIEAIERMHQPDVVKGLPVIAVAFLGLLINLYVAWLLTRGEQTLNIRAALLHVIGDVLGSIAALISGAVIYFTGYTLIDPMVSIFIGILITLASLRLLRESLRILMEAVPDHISLEQVARQLSSHDGVHHVHNLHIWTLSSNSIALSAHIHIHELSQWPAMLEALRDILNSQFQIQHVTLQPEPDIIAYQGKE